MLLCFWLLTIASLCSRLTSVSGSTAPGSGQQWGATNCGSLCGATICKRSSCLSLASKFSAHSVEATASVLVPDGVDRDGCCCVLEVSTSDDATTGNNGVATLQQLMVGGWL